MRIKGLLVVSLLLIAALAIAALVAGLQLPADARLPIHWNAAGTVDGWSGKWVALLLPVGLAVITTFSFVIAARIGRQTMARGAGVIRAVWIGMIGLACAIEAMVLSVAFGWPIAPIRLLLLAMGLLFVAMGDQFGKSRPTRFVGIRTSWTLTDPDVWIATHRLGGKLFVAAGLVWIAAGLFGLYGRYLTLALIAILLGAALFPVPWSYLLWRRAHR